MKKQCVVWMSLRGAKLKKELGISHYEHSQLRVGRDKVQEDKGSSINNLTIMPLWALYACSNKPTIFNHIECDCCWFDVVMVSFVLGLIRAIALSIKKVGSLKFRGVETLSGSSSPGMHCQAYISVIQISLWARSKLVLVLP